MSAEARLTVEKLQRRRQLRWLAAFGAAVTGFLMMRSALVPDPGLLDSPPPEIIGTWVTDDSRYAGRAFVIQEDEFNLEVAPGQIVANTVKTIRRIAQRDYDVYEITYFSPEGEAVQEMHLYPDGIVRLKNPSDVEWVRR